MKAEYITSESERKYRKKYYDLNREKICAAMREKYNQDPEKKREYNRQYAATHDRSQYFSERNLKKKEMEIV